MTNFYPQEKLSGAIRSMVTSPESIQRRIADAYVHHLSHVKAEDLPEEVRYNFSQFCERLTAVEAGADEGSAYATTSQMDEGEAIQLAHEILFMADAVASKLRA